MEPKNGIRRSNSRTGNVYHIDLIDDTVSITMTLVWLSLWRRKQGWQNTWGVISNIFETSVSSFHLSLICTVFLDTVCDGVYNACGSPETCRPDPKSPTARDLSRNDLGPGSVSHGSMEAELSVISSTHGSFWNSQNTQKLTSKKIMIS